MPLRVFNHLDQKTERGLVPRLRVDKKYRRTSRTFARGCFDQVKSGGQHRVECPLRTFDAERHMSKTSASAIFVDKLLHRRFSGKRLQELNQVGSFADSKQCFAHLVPSPHFLSMNLFESQRLVRLYLIFKFAAQTAIAT